MRAGLLTQRRASRQLIYAADFTVMNALLGYLTENCCGRGLPPAEACVSCSNLPRGGTTERRMIGNVRFVRTCTAAMGDRLGKRGCR